MMRTLAIGLAGLGFSLGLVNSSAGTIAFQDAFNDAGRAATTTYGTDGYDLYSTTPSGTNGIKSSTDPFGTGARITSLPKYVSSITASSIANFSASGGNWATINNPKGGTVEGGFTGFEATSSIADKRILTINFDPNNQAPSTFYIGIMVDISNQKVWYPDAIHLLQISKGKGDSGLKALTEDVNKGVDVYLFRVSDLEKGSQISIGGSQTTQQPDKTYDMVISGILFTQTVPEPSSVILLGVGGLALFAVCRTRGGGVARAPLKG
jgi:hypothetical protein